LRENTPMKREGGEKKEEWGEVEKMKDTSKTGRGEEGMRNGVRN